MRPGDFSPGNMAAAANRHRYLHCASMRPGDFSPGNFSRPIILGTPMSSFNEAGGFLPRKLTLRRDGQEIAGHVLQ